jgi:hypothetical protein
MATGLRRCGMCQLMKPNGISSDDGSVFICNRCNANAAQFLAIQDDLFTPPEASAEG